jgi:hypothetical protein
VSGVGFLMIVVVVFAIGLLFVWLRNRQPNNPLGSVGEFEREMQALGTTPVAVAGDHVEPPPRTPMNTVNIRPINPAVEPGQSVAADEDSPEDREGR